MLPITTSLLRLSLVPLEIARAYGEAFALAASLATPKLPAPQVDSSKGAAVAPAGNRVPSHQSTNSAKAMSTQFYGTQVATVAYQILFTKRDKEALLEQKTTTVATAMTGSGFASWKIAQFVRDQNGFPRPAEWKQEDVDRFATPVANMSPPDTQRYILNDDYLKFLQVEYQVLSTFDRKPPKDEVDVLERISSTLQTIEKDLHK